jgi:predicted membrane-bound spermidine synthase
MNDTPDTPDVGPQAGPLAGAPARRADAFWRHVPHSLFFFSCACIMVVELVAGRLIASHLGSSLYTWTAVIGVVLAGITAGNVIGGRLADRSQPETALRWLFVGAAVSCTVALGLNALFAATRPLRALDWPLQILLSVLAIFILPAAALGTLSPSLATMAVSRGRHVGSTLGSFYACGALGSIAGTFLTGFWLIFALGNTRVIVLTALMLVVLGAVSRLGGRAITMSEGPLALSERQRVEGQLRAGWDGGTAGGLLARRYTPHAIAFFSSVCLMVVELLASRIIATQAGSSLYTWTSVVGVVFAGMSLGNYVGGTLSDRFDPARFVGWLFLAASASAVGILLLTYVFATHEPFAGWHWPALVFTTVLCIFFVPSVLLGTFGPAATKVAVQRSAVVGTTIGSVSAWTAAGSILGTIASGFWLIPALGTRSLTMLVAVLLAAAGAALGPLRKVHVAWAAIAAAGLILTVVKLPALADWKYEDIFREPRGYAFGGDSAYQHVCVYEDTSEKEPDRTLRVVALDNLIHGYVDMADATYLNYDYERVYRDLLRRYVGDKTRVSAFFEGGGSYTFPRWLMAEWPGSEVVVAEIDPTVVEANHRATGLSRQTPIRTVTMDARNAVDDLPAGKRFDFFLGDAFNDLAVPQHLTTLEFSRKVAAHLEPGGAYLVNVIDDYRSGLLLGSFVSTLERVFKHVYVLCTELDGVSNRRDTFVIAASNVPLDIADWGPNHGGDLEGSALTGDNIAALKQKCGGRILTDDNAPVENLLAPVVRQRTRQE